MAGIHNTNLKKNYSEIVETNSLVAITPTINTEIQPTVEIQPYINIYRTSTSSTTLYTTPTDKEFYLTNMYMSACLSGALAGRVAISFYDEYGQQQTTSVEAGGIAVGLDDSYNQNCQQIAFPFRGVKVKKGTAITCTMVNTTAANAMIAGYTASDRS